MIDLWFLDQSGFAPTLPTGAGWGRLGTRLVVPDEAPQGRRVNAVGALAPHDPAGPRLLFETRRTAEGRYDAAAHLAFVARLAEAGTAGRPCVVVLDNYSVHHSAPVKAAEPALAEAGTGFCFLPPSRRRSRPPWPTGRASSPNPRMTYLDLLSGAPGAPLGLDKDPILRNMYAGQTF